MSEKKKVLLLFLIALIARAIALPFSQIVEADATSRLFLAEHALHNGGELLSLQWQSLHIYFLSFAQWISGERYIGPVIFSMLLGAGTIVPFYLFTRNVFSSKGAFITALLFSFSPIVFRLSFTPLSEIFFAFFTMLALWCLSEGILGKQKIKWALLGGIAMTISCGSRFEPWMLAVLFGLILLATKEWKMFVVFSTASAIFPVFWIIFCYLKTGSAFVSLDMIAHENFVVRGANQHVDEVTSLRRILFFPLSFLIAVTPLGALLLAGFLPRIFVSFRENKVRALFALLFLIMFVFFIYQAKGGMLATQHRYSITLVMLAFPAWAVWFENGKRLRMKYLVSLLILVLLLPFSFYWHRISWNRISFGNENLNNAIAQTVSGTYWEIQGIPRLRQQEFVLLADKTAALAKNNEGVFIDWCGWANTFYLGHRAPVGTEDIYMTGDNPAAEIESGRYAEFFQNHPKGTIFLSDLSHLNAEISLHGNLMEIRNLPGALILEPQMTQNHYRLFRYRCISPEEAEKQRQKLNFTPPLYSFVKDKAYFEALIPEDGYWLAGLWQEANKKRLPLETQVSLTAGYMAEQEKLNQNKNDTLK